MSQPDNLAELTNAEIRAKMEELNLPNIPVTSTSRNILINRIRNALAAAGAGGDDGSVPPSGATVAKKTRRETIQVVKDAEKPAEVDATTRRGRRSMAVGAEIAEKETKAAPSTKMTRRRSVREQMREETITTTTTAIAEEKNDAPAPPSPPRTRRRSTSIASDVTDESKPTARKDATRKRTKAQPVAILEEDETSEDLAEQPVAQPAKEKVQTKTTRAAAARRQSAETKPVVVPKPIKSTLQSRRILEEQEEPVRENTLPINTLIVLDSDEEDENDENEAAIVQAAINAEAHFKAEKQPRLGQSSVVTASYGVPPFRTSTTIEPTSFDNVEPHTQTVFVSHGIATTTLDDKSKGITGTGGLAGTRIPKLVGELPKSRIPRHTLGIGNSDTNSSGSSSSNNGIGIGLFNKPLSSLAPGEPLISASTLPKAPATFTGRYGAQPATAALAGTPSSSQRFRARNTITAAATPSIYTLRADPTPVVYRKDEQQFHDDAPTADGTPYVSQYLRTLNNQKLQSATKAPHFVSSQELNARRKLYNSETPPRFFTGGRLFFGSQLTIQQIAFALLIGLIIFAIIYVLIYAR